MKRFFLKFNANTLALLEVEEGPSSQITEMKCINLGGTAPHRYIAVIAMDEASALKFYLMNPML